MPDGVDSSDTDDSDADDEYEAQLDNAVTQISEELFGIRTLLRNVRIQKTSSTPRMARWRADSAPE